MASILFSPRCADAIVYLHCPFTWSNPTEPNKLRPCNHTQLGLMKPSSVLRATISYWRYELIFHHVTRQKTFRKNLFYQHSTEQCRYNGVIFLQNFHNREPIARLWGRGMRCLWWGWSLIYVLLLSSQCRVSYRDKFDRVIAAFDCISNIEAWIVHYICD